MPWFGKLIGFWTGFMLGGPVGAIIGAALGHGVDKNSPNDPYQSEFSSWTKHSNNSEHEPVNEAERRQSIFFATTFACAGKIAQADGFVSEDEVHALATFVKTYLKLGKNATEFAKRLFTEGARSQHSYEAVTTQFYDTFKNNTDIIRIFMDLQFTIAMADGVLHPNEAVLLQRAAEILQISDTEYNTLRSHYNAYARSGAGDYSNRYSNNDANRGSTDYNLDSCYAILDCSASDSMDTIRSKYRQKIQEFHPDKIVSKGLPEEFIEFANKKFDEIKNAYEKIKAARGA